MFMLHKSKLKSKIVFIVSIKSLTTVSHEYDNTVQRNNMNIFSCLDPEEKIFLVNIIHTVYHNNTEYSTLQVNIF